MLCKMELCKVHCKSEKNELRNRDYGTNVENVVLTLQYATATDRDLAIVSRDYSQRYSRYLEVKVNAMIVIVVSADGN